MDTLGTDLLSVAERLTHVSVVRNREVTIVHLLEVKNVLDAIKWCLC